MQKDAALYIKDDEARELLMPLAINTVQDVERLAILGENIRELAKPNAASDIADEAIKLSNADEPRC